jgi:Tfp pilus assembly protein PilV
MGLVEVMIALLVSTIGLFGTLALLGTLLKGGDFSRRITEASVLAQHKIEEQVLVPVSLSPATPADNANCPTPTVAQQTADGCNPLNALGQQVVTGSVVANAACSQTTVPQPTYTRSYYWCPSTDGSRRHLTVTVGWTDSITGTITHSIVATRDRTP